jgi:hydroxymethylglutaryl-CoA synthase
MLSSKTGGEKGSMALCIEKSKPEIGVSGFSVFLPRFRVSLKDWCEWTGASWEKVKANVGRSFRVAGPHESIYTMAANAALQLILKYEIDPRQIGFIGLGTESSTDNSAGGIIIKGMLDNALMSMGLPRISRRCEVPEYKHACLGGVYALKGASRYLAVDGKGKKAIVISVDLAEYERGSSGEQTQGAGAVAQLVEDNPRLYAIDLDTAGSASEYRGVDFRKPHRRHLNSVFPKDVLRFPDYPVFNGKYSMYCYTDQTIAALGHMTQNLDTNVRTLFNEVEGAFFHRPFHGLPVNVLAALYVWGLTQNEEHRKEFRSLCDAAGADYDRALIEANASPDLFEGALEGRINEDVYPESTKVVKHFRQTVKFKSVLKRKLQLGVETMMELGNLYTGSLPAWIAAGFEEAFNTGRDLAGKRFLTIGYGSGDAAEAILIRAVEGWEEPASKIGFEDALAGAIDLKQEEYEALHDCLSSPCPHYEPSDQFIVERIGDHSNGFDDRGIEYYRFVPSSDNADLTSPRRAVGHSLRPKR